MIRIITALAALAILSACTASPRNSSIRDGAITGLTSSEATTLAKKDARRQKVEAVVNNTKPIFRVEAFEGQPITINAKSIEVNVPLDLAVLMQEEPDVVSEEVQTIEAAGVLIQRATPIALGGMALSDRNSARKSAAALAETQAGVDKAQIAADAEEAAANREALAAANAATLAAQKEAEAARLAAALASAGGSTEAAPAE